MNKYNNRIADVTRRQVRIICLSTFLRSIRKSMVHFYVEHLILSVQSQSEGCLWTETETEPKKILDRNPSIR